MEFKDMEKTTYPYWTDIEKKVKILLKLLEEDQILKIKIIRLVLTNGLIIQIIFYWK